MTTEQITQKSFYVNGIEGGFLANKTGIAFMFFDQDGDRISKSNPSYQSEIASLLMFANTYAVNNCFTFQIR